MRFVVPRASRTGPLALAALAACASTPETAGWQDVARAVHDLAPGYAGAALLQPEPVDASRGAPRPGDQLLFGLTLDEGERRRSWLLLVELTPTEAVEVQANGEVRIHVAPTFTVTMTSPDGREWKSTSRSRPATVHLHDANGRRDDEADLLLPIDMLQRGFVTAVRESEHGTDVPARPEQLTDVQRHALATLIAVMQICQQTKPLERVMWQVLSLPSTWSMLIGFGARPTIDPRFQEARHASVDLDGRREPAFDVPLQIRLNDEPALLASLRVVEPRGLLALTGGVVSFAGFRPSAPDVRFRLHLLATGHRPEAPAEGAERSPR